MFLGVGTLKWKLSGTRIATGRVSGRVSRSFHRARLGYATEIVLPIELI